MAPLGSELQRDKNITKTTSIKVQYAFLDSSTILDFYYIKNGLFLAYVAGLPRPVRESSSDESLE